MKTMTGKEHPPKSSSKVLSVPSLEFHEEIVSELLSKDGIAVLAENAEATNVLLARVKDEKREAEEETEDAQDLSSDLARTVDSLHTKIDELVALAKASGADPHVTDAIKNRKNV